MGMFDRVYVDKEKLPISDEIKSKINDDIDWQTKDFDCEMTEIYITNEGELKINRFNYESVLKEERPYPNDDGLLGLVGSMKRVNEHLETIHYHGFVNFYSNIGEEWFEFNAKFTDGKLVEITRDVSA